VKERLCVRVCVCVFVFKAFVRVLAVSLSSLISLASCPVVLYSLAPSLSLSKPCSMRVVRVVGLRPRGEEGLEAKISVFFSFLSLLQVVGIWSRQQEELERERERDRERERECVRKRERKKEKIQRAHWRYLKKNTICLFSPSLSPFESIRF